MAIEFRKCEACGKSNRLNRKICFSCGAKLSKGIVPPEKHEEPSPYSSEPDAITPLGSQQSKLIMDVMSKMDRFTVTVAVISLIVGFFIGREYLKYELRSAMRSAISGVNKGIQDVLGGAKRPTRTSVPAKKSISPKKPSPIGINLLNKSYHKADIMAGDSGDRIDFTLELTNRIDKDMDAFTGAIFFTDIFDRQILKLNFTYDNPLASGETNTWKGGMEYNRFVDSHRKLRSTDSEKISVDLLVKEVIYSDGTRKTFSE